MSSIISRAWSTYRQEGLDVLLDRGRERVESRIRPLHTRIRTRNIPGQIQLLHALRETDDWVLIILDACRYDFFASEYDNYLNGNIRRTRSEGRDTFEYLQCCWPDKYDVTYFSGVPPANSYLDSDFESDRWDRDLYDGYVPAEHFEEIVDIWDYQWDEDTRATPPEVVTDAALSNPTYPMVVHYQQPHAPYVGEDRERHLDGLTLPELAERDDIGRPRILDLYRSNLIRGLVAVRRLISELDAERIVVTADHGEAIGGYGIWGHPRLEHPHTRVVPWMSVEGVSGPVDEATGFYQAEQNQESVESRLAHLGYMESDSN